MLIIDQVLINSFSSFLGSYFGSDRLIPEISPRSFSPECSDCFRLSSLVKLNNGRPTTHVSEWSFVLDIIIVHCNVMCWTEISFTAEYNNVNYTIRDRLYMTVVSASPKLTALHVQPILTGNFLHRGGPDLQIDDVELFVYQFDENWLRTSGMTSLVFEGGLDQRGERVLKRLEKPQFVEIAKGVQTPYLRHFWELTFEMGVCFFATRCRWTVALLL